MRKSFAFMVYVVSILSELTISVMLSPLSELPMSMGVDITSPFLLYTSTELSAFNPISAIL